MTKILLKNVRLSFPSLFQRSVFDGKEGKYEATLLIDKKDQKTINELGEISNLLMEKAKIKIPKDKHCIKDGDDSDIEGYAGNYSFKAANIKRPTVIDRDKTPLTADDEKLYPGCYVNAVVEFWIQNNAYGKRLNANLHGVQFVKDGEAFGNGPIDVTGDFDDLDDL